MMSLLPVTSASAHGVLALLAQVPAPGGAPAAPTPVPAPASPGGAGAQLPSLVLTGIVWAASLAAVAVLFLPERTRDQRDRIRLVGLAGSGLPLLLTLFTLSDHVGRDQGALGSDLMEQHGWLSGMSISSSYHLDADGVSLVLLLLSTLVFLCAGFASWKVDEGVRRHTLLLLLTETAVNGVLCAQDHLLFVLFWGMAGVPLFLLVSGRGEARRRRAAIRLLTVWTMSTALLLLAAILAVAVAARSGHASFDFSEAGSQSLDRLSPGLAAAAFWLTAAAFALILPVVPLHRWLVDVVEEADPVPAALIAGVVTRLGGYGLLRLTLTLSPSMASRFSLLIDGAAVLTLLWGALSGLAERSLARAAGRAAVAQGGLVLLAAGARTSVALTGAVLQLLASGLAATVLVLVCGVVRERTRTLDMRSLGGLAGRLPAAAWLWLAAVLSMVGVPFLAGFDAELMVMTGAFPAHRFAAAIVLAGLLVTAALLLLSFRRVFLGPGHERHERARDAGPLELTYLSPLAGALVFFGAFGGWVVPILGRAATDLAGRLGTGG